MSPVADERDEIITDDLALHVVQAGQGTPLVFLHSGFSFRGEHPFFMALASRYKVIALRHPGFGDVFSSLKPWMTSVDDIAYFHLDLLHQLGIQKAILVGCSLGAWIAAEMATKCPDRFSCLFLVAPIGIKVGPRDRLDIPDIFAMSHEALSGLLYANHDQARLHDATSDDELLVVAQNMQTTALMCWEPYMHNPKLQHRLHRITCPTLLIRGHEDGLVSADYLASYAALISNCDTITIPSAGHAVEVEQPQALVELISKFSTECAGAQR